MDKKYLLILFVFLELFFTSFSSPVLGACNTKPAECPKGFNLGLLPNTNRRTVNTCWRGIPFISDSCGPPNICRASNECEYVLNPDDNKWCDPVENTPVYTCLSGKCETAIGNIPVDDLQSFVEFVLQYVVAISGGIIVLMLIITGYSVLTSSGNPEKLQGAKENIVAVISGLLLIIFSQVLLKAVGADILKLPGF